MTDEVSYWDDAVTEEIVAIRALLALLGDDVNHKIRLNQVEQAVALDRVETKIRNAKRASRSLKVEIRLVSDPTLRRKYERRFQEVETDLQSLAERVTTFRATLQRGELFVQHTSYQLKPTVGEKEEDDGVKAGDALLHQAGQLQDQTQDSLDRTMQMIDQSKKVGMITLEELQRQREVIQGIDRDAERANKHLVKAEVMLKRFRRMLWRPL